MKQVSKKNNKLKYNPNEIELKWQAKWQSERVYQPDLDSANPVADSKSSQNKPFDFAQGGKKKNTLSASASHKKGTPFYNLMMFPYPSAEGLHVGSMYAFGGVDVYGRYKRMQGYQVFEPIGLDGFGIHSENHAIKTNTHPVAHAERTEKNFYRQLHATGNSYAWENKVETYDPEYYRWTQWLFVQLFKSGLAYKKKSPVNFCPSCKTVLSDEQVIDGKCERCNSVVEKKELEQWFFKITQFAERLLGNIEGLDWTEKVKLAQRNWIGKSEGVRFMFSQTKHVPNVEVFTTAIDTVYGVTFVVISPEHPLLSEIMSSITDKKRRSEVEKYRKEASLKSIIERQAEGKEKTGVFSGAYVKNPLTEEEVPLWVADYVLMDYGTGIVMGVPGHDARDHEFAQKFGLEIRPVIRPKKDVSGAQVEENGFWDYKEIKRTFKDKSELVNSGELNGMTSKEANAKVISLIEKQGYGKREVTYHLRDWLISRQRYWGPPIPMIYCESCAEKGKSWFSTKKSSEEEDLSSLTRFGAKELDLRTTKTIPDNQRFVNEENNKGVDPEGVEPSRPEFLGLVPKPGEPTPQSAYTNEDKLVNNDWNCAGWYPEEELPVKLPYIENFKPLGTGKAPLANHPEFYETTCPKCDGKAIRETDVSDTFLDSAWYFLRYLATDWDDQPFPSVTYAKEKLAKAKTKKEIENWQLKIEKSSQREAWLPVTAYIGGAEHSVLHLLYARFVTMALHDMGYLDFEEPFSRFYAHGLIIKDGAKMSKSKGNVVNPDTYIAKYGADTLRTYLMFLGPFNQGGDFRDSGIEGMNKFLKRVWKLFTNSQLSTRLCPQGCNSQLSDDSLRIMHETIKGVTEDMEQMRFNTAIAKLMTWYNFLAKQEQVSKEEVETYLKLFAPFAPHMTEDLYQQIFGGQKSKIKNQKFTSIHLSEWPVYDDKYLKQDTFTIAVQVNGKLRGTVVIEAHETDNKTSVEKLAREQEGIAKFLHEGMKKVIYVQGKILNFVGK